MKRPVKLRLAQEVIVDGWLGLIIKNAGRAPLRGIMTVTAVAVSLVAFILVRSVNAGWTAQIEQTPDNRIVMRHKSGWGGQLPVRHVQTIRDFDGIRRAMGASWGQLKLPIDKQVSFESIAVDAEPFIAMHYELVAPAKQKMAFVTDRRGAFISAELATEQGWAVGDVLHFKRANVAKTIELAVSGVFQSQRNGFAQRAVYLHWDYLNELLPIEERDLVNIVAAELTDRTQGAKIATLIDIHFEQGSGQTLTQEDQAVNAQLVGQFSAILKALNMVGYLILGIVLLVLSNTVAMIVRERTKEYGALRSVGFLRKHLMRMVLGESALLGFAGGLCGLLLALPLVEQAASAYLADAMSMAPLKISWELAVTAVGLGVLLGGIAGIYPGYQLTRTSIVDSLRRVA